jgi:hypothetical protein
MHTHALKGTEAIMEIEKFMPSFDLCLVWDWEYDADFVSILEWMCRSRGIKLLQITPENLVSMQNALYEEKVKIRTFFDRASDIDDRFAPLVRWACEHVVEHINYYNSACRARNKVVMYEAISTFIRTPYTIVLPAYDELPSIPSVDLGPLGDSFFIKPAHGGGGEGVIKRATSFDQVCAARQHFPSQKYLLQGTVFPAQIDSRKAWFRVIYCDGNIYPCWWDLDTHVYMPVTQKEEENNNLHPLKEISAVIADICELELFSTEIALTPEGYFLVVDYVNDPIDLRLQSRAFDGVPDDIVSDVIETLLTRKVMRRNV